MLISHSRGSSSQLSLSHAHNSLLRSPAGHAWPPSFPLAPISCSARYGPTGRGNPIDSHGSYECNRITQTPLPSATVRLKKSKPAAQPVSVSLRHKHKHVEATLHKTLSQADLPWPPPLHAQSGSTQIPTYSSPASCSWVLQWAHFYFFSFGGFDSGTCTEGTRRPWS